MNVGDILLVTYLEGKLDPDTARAVELAAETDAAVQARLASLRGLSSAQRADRAAAFYATQSQSMQAVRAHTTAKRTRSFALAAAALLLGALLGFGLRFSLLAPPAIPDLLDEVAEYHEVFSQETRHLVEVPAKDKLEFQAWLGSRLGVAFTVPDLASEGLSYAGGRMLVVAGRAMADLIYVRISGSPVALCLTRSDARMQSLRVDQRGDLTVASWADGRFAYFVVGELESAAATRVARAAAAGLGI